MQRLCKSNAIKLALIAEMPPILCKDTVFLSHRQTSWIILTQRLRVSVQKCHNAPICGLFAKPANFIFTSNPQPIGFRGNLLVKRQKFFYCTYFLGITETS